MSRTINKDWIQKSLKSLVCSDKKVSRTPKVCVIVDVDRTNKMITLSDTIYKIKAFLTDSCVEKLEEEHIDISTLKYCIIKLEIYHYSTILQCCAGDRFPGALSGLNYTFEALPTITAQFCIQLLEFSYLANGFQSQHTPSNDINRNIEIINGSLNLKNYAGVVDRLVSAQFPNEVYLPDAQGRFYIDTPFNDMNPLISDYCHTNEHLMRKRRLYRKQLNNKKILTSDESQQKTTVINEAVFKHHQPPGQQSNVLMTGKLTAADVSKDLTCREDIDMYLSMLSRNDQPDTYVGDSPTIVMMGEDLLHTQLPPTYEYNDNNSSSSSSSSSL